MNRLLKRAKESFQKLNISEFFSVRLRYVSSKGKILVIEAWRSWKYPI